MTMPDERMRALRWGGELLVQLTGDALLPDTAIDVARQIALTYPTQQLLEEWLRSGAAGLPAEWTAAFVDAYLLFEALSCGDLGSAKTRTDSMYTLRHYPDERTIRVMSRSSNLKEWLG